jgi:RimJ/RimL family protein N-acetyltransferase
MSIPTPTPPNPPEASDTLRLADGTRLRLRPINADDRDRFAELFGRLSFESRRRRFLTPKPELTPQELAFFSEVDHVGHEAIAAVDQRDGSIAGLARYVGLTGRATEAEVAVEVADALQRMGIGTALVRHLVERARANGFACLTATTLWENRPARALLRRVGFRAQASRGTEIEFALELVPASGSSRTPTKRTDT